jgi:hypothetical protein
LLVDDIDLTDVTGLQGQAEWDAVHPAQALGA